MKSIPMITLAILLLAVVASARVPQTMNVQGVLMDDLGHPLPDGDYTVSFMLWDAPTDGSDFWNEDIVVTQANGYFDVILNDVDPLIFDKTLWLSMQVAGDSVMEPRIEMTSVGSALMAARVDRNAAVLSLNGLKNNVQIQGGANVTVTQADSTITISAAATGGGDDGDWTISGDDLYKDTGRVHVGTAQKLAEVPDAEPVGDEGAKMPASSKLEVVGQNEGLSVLSQGTDTAADGRTSIYAERQASPRNHGLGFGPTVSNSAITAFDGTGDSFSFGLRAYGNPYYSNSGALIAANTSGSVYTALTYRDSDLRYWGVYSTRDIHSDGLLEGSRLRVETGAAAGYILTSDASGYASWAPPAAAGSDADWEISGNHLTHAVTGTVALGTGTPRPLADTSGFTTLQISNDFAPGICLDATYGGLSRWNIYQNAQKIYFSHATTYTGLGSAIMSIEEDAIEVKNESNGTGIRLQGRDSMESGPAFRMYSTSTATTLPAVTLDAQSSSSNFGGAVYLRDGNGELEVEITANHNSTGVGRVITPVLEITGGSDLSEQFDVGNALTAIEPGMVVSIDPENPGRLALAGEAYDRRVAGVISGAGGVNTGMVMGQRGTVADGEMPVALVGRVYVWADASTDPIEPGDLLTTAERPGHAMKVKDHERATGAILGKAMTGLSEGQGLILTLVTLQ